MDAAALWRLFDMIGTIAFAVSGTLVGISRRMDIFGISVLASLAGAFVFCLLRPVLGVEVNSWLAFTLALLIRFAAIRGNWSLYHPRPPRRKR